MAEQEHWEALYGQSAADRVSWYRPHLEQSIAFIEGAGLGRDAAIIDVGGGASTLVDDLLDRSYTDMTVLDASPTAISAARQRLGPRAEAASWLVADIIQVELPERRFDFWHDRAVLHFLGRGGVMFLIARMLQQTP